MNKLKLAVFAGAATAVAVVSILAVHADTAPLAVTCSGVVSSSSITWTAAPTGGNTPYTLSWSGDSKVAGSTSTVINATYVTNGTYTAMIQAMDASSTIATSTCSGTVTSIVTPVATSTLNVIVGVNNSAGGSAIPSNFSVSMAGAAATPSSFAGNASGTAVTVNGGSTYTVGASSIANYTMTESGNCGGPIVSGGTDSCTVTETFVPTVVSATTSTLNVSLSVNNTGGGSAIPSNFSIAVTGANPVPGSFAGSSSGTAVVVTGGATYSVTVTPVANYTGNATGNCGGPITAGGSDNCSIVETFVPTVATSTPPVTPPLPRVNPPSLSIGPNGAFLARGMTVTNVASGSFTGTVWGITYTVNWTGNLYPEFYYRGGNGGSATDPTQQVTVGDEVGVAGKVSTANPMVVTASVVRDYSITMPRPKYNFSWGPGPKQTFGGHGNNGGNNGGGNGGNNGNKGGNGNGYSNDQNQGAGQGNGGNQGGGQGSNSSSVSADFNARIGDLMNQLHGLQNLFKGKFGK